MLLTRRELLRLATTSAGIGLAPHLFLPRRLTAAAAPWSSPYGFLTAEEMAILDAATASIVPSDGAPGARECGVVDYIQSLLSFMPGSDVNCDQRVNAADLAAAVLRAVGASASCREAGDVDGSGRIDAADVTASEAAVFRARPVDAGGPFSDRQPQPHFPTGSTPCRPCHVHPIAQPQTGAAATIATEDNYPPNFFREHSPLSRVRALSWKVRILGAAGVPEVADNPLATELVETDMRRKYREGLAELESRSQTTFGKSFVALAPPQQTQVLDRSDPGFVLLLTYQTVEGLLCPPEYGGNRDRLGWQLVGFDGDSQPLGYAIYDETAPGGYREREDKPNSGPNPDEDCRGFSAEVDTFLSIMSTAALVAPGGPFPEPYCFEVEE